MGMIQLRKFSQIHDKSVKLLSDEGETTHVFYMKNHVYKTKKIINNNEVVNLGCSTSTCYKKFPMTIKEGEIKSELLVQRVNLDRIPSKLRTLSNIKNWISFITETFPFLEIEILAYDGKEINNTLLAATNQHFDQYLKNNAYFTVKKDFYNDDIDINYMGLMAVSFIRALSNREYYYTIYDTLRLRKLKSLSELSNLEIINIARFGNQLNDFHHKSLSPYSNESYYGFLRGYRYPYYNQFITPVVETDINKIKNSLIKAKCQNNSVMKYDRSTSFSIYLIINSIYLMFLFEKKQYYKIHKLTTNKKYFSSLTDAMNHLNNCNISNYKKNEDSLNYFKGMNNKMFDIKKYEKTL